MADRKAYSPDQVAKILGVSRNTVYTLVRSGELGSFRLGRGMKSHIRIPAAEVDRLMNVSVD